MVEEAQIELYRVRAENLRHWAEEAVSPQNKDQVLAIASQYEGLAVQAETEPLKKSA